MTELEAELRDLLVERGEIELAETGERRWPDTDEGKPERWWETPHWRCVEGHVSRWYVGTDQGGKCPVCYGLVFLTHPEDRDGPLMEISTDAT